MKKSRRKVKEYLSKPYSFIVTEMNDESGHYFVARVLELDGLIGTGKTYKAAYDGAREAMESYIETKIARHLPIPEPIGSQEYSGKFVLRLPKTLHKMLSVKAKEEGVSLNQYALYKLAL